MTTFFLSGHRDFGNRGCEAIVRSTVAIIRNMKPEAKFIVPSTDVVRDKALWPTASEYGVSFHSCLQQSITARAYGKVRKKIDFLNNIYPLASPPRESQRLIDMSDAVLAVGGDNYSEDYSLPYLPVILDNYAMNSGKPTILWGASVGPFERSKPYQSFMSKHMRRYTSIFVREHRSEAYCREQLGVDRINLFADPAFALMKEDIAISEISEPGGIGVNISPLILSKLGDTASTFVDELSRGLSKLQNETGLDVVLIPHVMAYSGPNDDRIVLRTLAERLQAIGVRTQSVPDDLNAAQIKTVISRCNVIIAARTHATIAAMSQGVPVVSIGYSVKATGINELVFGDARHVLDYRELRSAELVSRVERALTEGKADTSSMSESRSKLKASAYEAGQVLHDILISR